jgi:hypothetical protein
MSGYLGVFPVPPCMSPLGEGPLERSPAKVTLTSLRAAGLDGRLPAAPRTWRQ